ncbi:S8 family serine peptidase [bacterium]|nr:S8 family serine peptidase [bacterium]
MKKVILFILLFSIVTVGYSADGIEKLDVRLKMLMKAKMQSQTVLSNSHPLAKQLSQKYLNVFVRGNVSAIKAEIESVGGFVNTVTENILTAQVPQNSIMDIARSSAVTKIKLAVPLKIKNNEAIKHVQADKVHAGDSPLTASYSGKNVIVGIIDSGIDWKHEDFRSLVDPTKSRILYIWDQNDSLGGKPVGFSYGAEWTKAQIEDEIDGTPAGVVRHKDDNPEAGGHGTHVSGTACGNKGIAPEADIIVVGLDFEHSTGIVDAANYIYTKAAELGRPAVINASVGSHYGPHDGSGAEPMALDQLITAVPGRAFCASAGNEGSDFLHFGGFELNGQEAWTYYYGQPPEGETETYLQLYMIVKNEYVDGLFLAVGMDSIQFDEYLTPQNPVNVAKTNWKSIRDISANEVAEILSYRNGEEAGSVMIEARIGADKTELMIQIQDDWAGDANYTGLDLWRLCVKGSGQFHAWTEGVMSIPFPDQIGLTVDSYYRIPDNNYSINIPGDAHEIITVGAYVNRETWIDIDGTTQPSADYRETLGTLANFSSIGPTVDYRIKPEIVAPGHYVASALSSYIVPENSDLLPDGIHVIMSGTSMSSPVTAGAVALLLEQQPDYTNAQIRSHLFDYTITDKHVQSSGDMPNPMWGYGKLDILGAMTEQNTAVAEGHSPLTAGSYELQQNYPNPFNPSTVVSYTLPASADVKLSVFNTLGQRVRTLVEQCQAAGLKNVTWDGKDDAGKTVSGGLYFFRMNAESKGKQFKSLTKGILLK